MFDGRIPEGTTLTAVRDDRIHIAITPERAGNGGPVPIRGLIFLRESADHISLEQVASGRALPDLWTLSFRYRGADQRPQSFVELAELARAIPLWNLHRPLERERLDEVVARIVEAVTVASG
jgi:hypothetical protein